MNAEARYKEELQVAMVQFEPAWEQIEENLSVLNQILGSLSSSPDLIVLPEAFATGFSMDAEQVSENMDGQIVQWMKTISDQKQVALCGSVFVH